MRDWRSNVLFAACLFCILSALSAQGVGRQFAVIGLDVPTYPPVALSARLEGAVLISLTVSNGVVQKADVKEGANALLASAAKRNVLSWRFAPEATGAVDVRFEFELAKTEVALPEPPEIQMVLPGFVKVIAKPVKPVTVH